jgi:biopolymer transport protein ExbD
MNIPKINVTPLIDVLLVLLIIFMVVSPLRPGAFKAKVPRNEQTLGDVNPKTLIVTIGSDLSLTLNKETSLGSVNDASPLTERLKQVFKLRNDNLDYAQNEASDRGFSSPDNIERTVFIKAPKSLPYGQVAKVVDAVKLGGAAPVSLQIDGLD